MMAKRFNFLYPLGLTIVTLAASLLLKFYGDNWWVLAISLVIFLFFLAQTLYRAVTTATASSKFATLLDALGATLFQPRFDRDYWRIKTLPEKIFVTVTNLFLAAVLIAFFIFHFSKNLGFGLAMIPLGANFLATAFTNLRLQQKNNALYYFASTIVALILMILSFSGFIF